MSSKTSATTFQFGQHQETVQGGAKRKVWNRKKQEWVEVEDEEQASLGGQQGGAESRPQSSNSYASGNNQNSGNYITDKPTTRVHAPPGGRTTINLGSYEAEEPRRQASPRTPPGGKSTFQFGGDHGEAKQSRRGGSPGPKSTFQLGGYADDVNIKPKNAVGGPNNWAAQGGAQRPVSSNAYANGNNQNSGNFITDKPSTRVRAPPGGQSSITFG